MLKKIIPLAILQAFVPITTVFPGEDPIGEVKSKAVKENKPEVHMIDLKPTMYLLQYLEFRESMPTPFDLEAWTNSFLFIIMPM